MRTFILMLLLISSSVFAEQANIEHLESDPGSERITSFHSDIIIRKNADMQVTETIDVIARGDQIRRGIYRDFPTRYQDRFNNRYKVGFEFKSLLRNQESEDYRIQPQANGLRIYFGNEDRLLPHGRHRYRFRYLTNRQLGFFSEHDELYWNVTGNDWDFTIDKASVDIQLPEGIPRDKIILGAYTGYQGEQGADFKAFVDVGNHIHFETTQPLLKQQGLTIVVSFPKGFVDEPSTEDKIAHLMRDNRHLLYAMIGILLLLGYYWYSWLKVGKDPEQGVVIPLYHPPQGYSPASMRFIEKMAYDDTCFATAIINLAVKGYLTINEDSTKQYTLSKTGKDVAMAAGESALVSSLFKNSDQIILKQSNHARIKSAINSHKASLKNDFELKYFLKNTAYFVIGLLISIIVLAIVLLTARHSMQDPNAIFLIIWLVPWTFSCLIMAKSAWNQFAAGNKSGLIKSLFVLAPFLFFEVMVLSVFIKLTSISLMIVLIALCIINWLFYEWLKKPTFKGRKLLDKIEGFREYIKLAEKHELDYKHPKGKCPELFEQYLPFALAMDVEDSWAKQFAAIIEKTQLDDNGYSPGWYQGRHWSSTDLSGFTSSLHSNFSSAIASSSTAPGSSSGSGGGGFSGGGGGGGGGGGW